MNKHTIFAIGNILTSLCVNNATDLLQDDIRATIELLTQPQDTVLQEIKKRAPKHGVHVKDDAHAKDIMAIIMLSLLHLDKTHHAPDTKKNISTKRKIKKYAYGPWLNNLIEKNPLCAPEIKSMFNEFRNRKCPLCHYTGYSSNVKYHFVYQCAPNHTRKNDTIALLASEMRKRITKK